MEYMLETEHLRVRKFEPEDAQCLYENHSEEEVRKWIPNESYADIEEAQGAIGFYVDCVNNGRLPYVLAVELKETGELIGDTGVNEVEGKTDEVEIGYGICKKHSGKGYATELLEAMTEFIVSTFGINVLYGRVMRGNDASVRVLEKNGYIFVKEEFGAEDDPYGNGMLIYKRLYHGRYDREVKMSELITLNPEYAEWIRNVGVNFKQCQIKAASKVNEEMLRFYWNLGRDIALIIKHAGYGSEFYKNLSADLQKELPDVRSFSVTNLKYMKYFYEMYCPDANRQQLVDDFATKISQQSVDDFIDERIFHIPWGHHIQIINKCKGHQEKALFFLYKTIENNWSRSVLMNFLDTNLYERQGKAVTNFSKILPDTQSDLAQEMTKDKKIRSCQNEFFCFDVFQ